MTEKAFKPNQWVNNPNSVRDPGLLCERVLLPLVPPHTFSGGVLVPKERQLTICPQEQCAEPKTQQICTLKMAKRHMCVSATLGSRR